VLAVGLGIAAFAPYEHRDAFPPYGYQLTKFFGEYLILWIPISTLVMFTVPLSLIVFPNVYVVSVPILYLSLWGCLESGNEELIPNIELLVYSVLLIAGCVGSFIQLKNQRLTGVHSIAKTI